MFPVRVAVETVRAQNCLTCANDGHILIDTYAIVSGATTLAQLVDTVLSALGHPHLALNARGMVQVNNWKALPFEQITDNMEETVHTLFKEIASQITLRILTKPSTSTDSASAQCVNDVRQRLLKTAISKNPSLINTIENAQIRELIAQIIGGEESPVLNHDQINVINEWAESMDQSEERRSPLAQVRFNNAYEIPKLEKWFKAEPNPSRQKLIQFMNQLNTSTFRKNHQKISYQQICNWFSTQRATRRPALLAQAQLSQIQTLFPTIIGASDYKPKIDFNNLIESCQKSTNGDIHDLQECTRVDGGSDSPSPGDDEIHSNSDNGINDIFKQESTASSPDLSANMFMNGSLSMSSSSPRHIPMDLSGGQQSNNMNLGAQARSRLMFDPLTELPILEKWFEENPHPSWMQIDQYTQMLNSCPYRENYPHISQHNVKIWFKNRRAKCKRMQTGMIEKLEKIFS